MDHELFERSGLPLDFRKDRRGQYIEELTRVAWDVWQAAARTYRRVD